MSASEIYRVIGHPLGHSMSPFIHRRLFALADRAPVQYDMTDIPPEQLDQMLPALLRKAAGINVTIPHKRAVIPFLTRLEGRAELYQSVNTIAVRETETVGYNTDADGFLLALRDGGIKLEGRVLLLGCGGVGRTFACECALAGCEIVNAVRDEDLAAAAELRQYVLGLSPKTAYSVLTLNELAKHPLDAALLINATPVGMYPNADAAPVNERVAARCAAVFDAVYNPRHTRLLQMAEAAGARTVGGMPMLVWQAAAAHRLWYGQEFAPADIRALVEDSQQEMQRLFG